MTTTPFAPPPVRRGGLGRVLLILVSIGLILAGVLAAVGVGTRSLRGTESVRSSYEGVRELRVTAESGDVVVTAGVGPTVAVALTTDRSFQKPEISAERDGDVLVVAGRCPGGFDWLSFGRCRADFEITAPAGTRLVLESSAGELAASGMRADASLRSRAGDVEVADHQGSLSLETSAGEVVANDVQAERIEARSQAGDVLILTRTPSEQLTARTGAGDVDITVPDAAYAVETDTSAGSVDASDLRTDPRAPYRIEASTSAGDITLSARR
jgi:hypothetical protein